LSPYLGNFDEEKQLSSHAGYGRCFRRSEMQVTEMCV
jgi:hypothetical protein